MYFCHTPAISRELQFFALRDGYRAAAPADSGSYLPSSTLKRNWLRFFKDRLCVVCHRFLPYDRSTDIANAMRFELRQPFRNAAHRWSCHFHVCDRQLCLRKIKFSVDGLKKPFARLPRIEP
jgi:hypothetical protein